jgi:hypothetical protein
MLGCVTQFNIRDTEVSKSRYNSVTVCGSQDDRFSFFDLGECFLCHYTDTNCEAKPASYPLLIVDCFSWGKATEELSQPSSVIVTKRGALPLLPLCTCNC